MDTRAFSMARKMRCNGLRSVSLFLVAASISLSTPAMARDVEDGIVALPVANVAVEGFAFIRPLPRPDYDVDTAQVSRSDTTAPLTVFAPEPLDRGRIRQTWSIGVFR